MHKDMLFIGQKPSVSALALFSTDFVSVENAIAWIYDTEDSGSSFEIINHPFVACAPAIDMFTKSYVKFIDEEDLEHSLNKTLMICYICGNERERHSIHDDKIVDQRPREDMILLS